MKKLWWLVLAVALVATSVGCKEEPECEDNARSFLRVLRNEAESTDVYTYYAQMHLDDDVYKTTARNILKVEKCAEEMGGMKMLGTNEEEMRSFKKEALLRATKELMEMSKEGYPHSAKSLIEEMKAVSKNFKVSLEEIGWSEKTLNQLLRDTVLNSIGRIVKDMVEDGDYFQKWFNQKGVAGARTMETSIIEYSLDWPEIYAASGVEKTYQAFSIIMFWHLNHALADYPTELLWVSPRTANLWAKEHLRDGFYPEEIPVYSSDLDKYMVAAYTRLAAKLLKDLRAGKYEYPQTIGVVNDIEKYLQEAGRTLYDIGVCPKEMDQLIQEDPVVKTKPNC